MDLMKVFLTTASLLWDSFTGTPKWDAPEDASLHEVRTGADMIQEVSMVLQDALVMLLESDEGEEPETKLLPLSDLFSPVISTGLFAIVPLVIIFSLYLGVMLWASSSIRRADDYLQQTISDLNTKADQISEGIAALAQIYIDNPPPGYGRRHASESLAY
ncbi:uncharacterized protein [Palaemon carinicauda]|uniref:uncharacterized protein n=1 Tax=Palaemon carinicauda TaxID=392227 RepID=UPI0035B57C50